MTIKKQLEKWVHEEKEKVHSFMPDVTRISDESTREVISRYAAAIEPNFIPWMAAGLIYANTSEGKSACESNLKVEIEEDHQSMLHNFVKEARALPGADNFIAIDPEVGQIRGSVDSSAIYSISLLTYLENTSTIFVPVLEDLGRNLGVKDFTYTKKHGAADIMHANQFLSALESEIKYIPKIKNVSIYVGFAANDGRSLLKRIFTP